jgi:hypothetical protein
MSSELLFINITEAISAVSFLFGCNMVLTYSLFRQELPFGNIFTPFKVMKGFSKKEWILFILLIINSAIFAIISMNAHNSYLHKYGAKPDTWLF